MRRRQLIGAAGAAALATDRTAAAGPPDGNTMTDDVIPFASKFCRTPRHVTHYLEAGPTKGPPVVLVHGWPELSIAWRHQMRALSLLGFRVIAPDLRGCGQSARYHDHDAYAQRQIVRDMLELADTIGAERAVWVGHDWGATVAWNIARHHPDRCHGVAALCVPYDTLEHGSARMIALVDRRLYPAGAYPAGQYDYMEFYHEHFDAATRVFETKLESTFKVIMRRGDPSMAGKPFPTALVRRQGGWFGPGQPAPDVPLDTTILTEADLAAYVAAYRETGFFGVDSLYMNDADNDAYARQVSNDIITMPTLFLSGRNDFVNDTERSDLAGPMRAKCRDLSYRTIDSGHWMQHEQPQEVNAAICRWIGEKVSSAWPA